MKNKLATATLSFEERAIKYYKNEMEGGYTALYNRVIHESEYQELLRCFPEHSAYRLVFGFLYHTGCRISECAWLNIKDFPLKKSDGEINFSFCRYKVVKRYVTIKGERYPLMREVWLSEGFAKELEEYWKYNKEFSKYGFVFRGNGRLFVNPRSVNAALYSLRKQGRLNGRWMSKLPNGHYLIDLHSFRRTWIASYAEKYGSNVYEVTRAIGHTSPETTLKYIPPAPPEHLQYHAEQCWKVTLDAKTFIPAEQGTLARFF